MAPAEGAKAAVSRIEELRRLLASTPEATARARLRVELADLLRARADPFSALSELRRAAGEAPQLTSVRLALLSAAAELPAGERAMLLAEHARGDRGPVAIWAHAAALARAENGAVEEATRAFLDLAGDPRVSPHRRRAAARRAEALAEKSPRQQIAALRVQATLASGRARLALLRRAATIAERVPEAATLLGVAHDWLAAGGAADAAAVLLARARSAGGAVTALAALENAIVQRTPRPESGSTSGVAAAVPAEKKTRTRTPQALADDALAAALDGRPGVARRLAERAARSAPADGADVVAAVTAVVTALQDAGAARDALLLRRTCLEAAPEDTRPAALAALAIDADSVGLEALAAGFRADSVGRPPSLPVPADDPVPATPAGFFLAAQRALVHLPAGAPVDQVLALLEKAVAGHAAADDALALGEKLLRQTASPDVPFRIIDLLRAANSAEPDPTRRARVAERLASALETERDPLGAVAVLDAALDAIPPGAGASLRQRRARMLRDIGRPKDLSAALQGDIPALDEDARRDAFAERALLLENAGDADGALEIRLLALNENPGDLPLLQAARRQLDDSGRWELSLRLATSAVSHLNTADEKLPLLRDIARLNETAAHNLPAAANAWLEVTRLDRDDATAAESAERLLMAIGQWDRCASLLAWVASRSDRQGDPARRAALLWRLAELRRAHLGQEEEAFRLYSLLGKETSPHRTGKKGRRPLPAQADPAIDLVVLPPVAGALGRALAMRSLRAAVAPTRVDLAAALLDRAMFLVDPLARVADAQRDLARALDLDPRNVDVVVALERLTERTGRWADLADELRRKAAASPAPVAARLWYGVGRIGERQSDPTVAEEAYRQACALDVTLIEPVAALRRLARLRRDWPEVARLLEIEHALSPGPREQAETAAELAQVLGDHLQQPERAVALLESALTFFPDDTAMLQRLFALNLAAGGGRWEHAGQVLDRLLAHGVGVDDAAERYFRVGEAAAAEGHVDRALGFYSRAYGRDSGFRPNLERLSKLCFELEQWDNAWKATEAILDRYRHLLVRGPLAELLLRSALCDVFIAQRATAAARLTTMLSDGGRFVGEGGIRDVAESWSGMGLEPRLLVGLEGERRERVLRRSGEALSFAASDAATADVRTGALGLLAALGMVESRWADALRFLGELGANDSLPPPVRCGYLIAAGDIHLHEGADAATARSLYEKARALVPGDIRLALRLAVPDPLARPPSDPLFVDDDEEEPTGVDVHR
ncbi:MAG TPA: tetratricopeptide repeat protein [Polyangia bacterium]